METKSSIAQDDKIETVKKTLFSASEVSTWSLGSRLCLSYDYIVTELGLGVLGSSRFTGERFSSCCN